MTAKPTARFRALIGTGGIGAGRFFALTDNRPLGREESRGGKFLDRRDYCKLHIIAHYVQALAGSAFTVIPIGAVGDDAAGQQLVQEISAAGLSVRHVRLLPGVPTLFSFCLLYPDGAGGNLTTVDSASSQVAGPWMDAAEAEFRRFAGQGIALAAPEVPLAARVRLLELATRHRFFRVASFVSAEVEPALAQGLFARLDLVALNLDEAAQVIGRRADTEPAETIIGRVVDRLGELNPRLAVSITAGVRGSWCWDGGHLVHQPIFSVAVANTAGAGDAHLAGLLTGLAANLPWPAAQQLGSLVAALSVTSPHTIHPGLNRQSLAAFARTQVVITNSALSQWLREAG